MHLLSEYAFLGHSLRMNDQVRGLNSDIANVIWNMLDKKPPHEEAGRQMEHTA